MTNRIGDSLHHFAPNEDLVRALIDHQVRFVLVGGLAMAWYCPARTADDMDLLVDSAPENSARLAVALRAVNHGTLTEDEFCRPGLQAPLKSYFYAELLTPQAGAPSFDEVAARASEGKLFGLPIRIASPSDLIAMKQRAIDQHCANARKHLDDIALLKNV